MRKRTFSCMPPEKRWKPFLISLRRAQRKPSNSSKEHKKGIVAGTVAAIGAVAYVANNSHEKDQLLEKNARLTEENAQLSDDLVIEREVSDRLASRVVELESLR